MCDCLRVGFCVVCLKILLAICEIGGKKGKCVGVEIEVVFEFVE